MLLSNYLSLCFCKKKKNLRLIFIEVGLILQLFGFAAFVCVVVLLSHSALCLLFQSDHGSDQSLGNQQTAVINLGGFMSPQAGMVHHDVKKKKIHITAAHISLNIFFICFVTK